MPHVNDAGLLARVERALAEGRGPRVVEPMLERLLASSERGSEAALLAHRELAKIRLERHPWRALIHLRHVARSPRVDAPVHAMRGLALMLLGHAESAAAAFRQALRIDSNNAAYQHNLGHLLDVGLGQPARALPHLRRAFELAGHEEPRLVESYADCLARLGKHADAEALRRPQRTATPPRSATPMPAPTADPAIDPTIVFWELDTHIRSDSEHARRAKALALKYGGALLSRCSVAVVAAACHAHGSPVRIDPRETSARYGITQKALREGLAELRKAGAPRASRKKLSEDARLR